jgi:neutral ceramidase
MDTTPQSRSIGHARATVGERWRGAWRTAVAVALYASAGVASAGNFEIGTGIYDITGPVAETGMFGYAASQETDGLHQRLYARAFVVKAPGASQRVVFVSADQGAIFQSVKLEVVRRLQVLYGSTYTHANVMLTATHTHVGSSGVSHYLLYQAASNDKSLTGYDTQAYEAVVSGIVNAIKRAHNNLALGSIDLAQGDLTNATKNRSVVAYQANPDAASYTSDTNKRMVQLKFTKDNGKEVGLLNWFAIHNTSLSQKFTKVSGDNKGYAQWRFEKSKGTRITDAETFVAAFANSDEGDVVPSDGNAFSKPGFQGSSNEYANAVAAGSKQFDRASQLYSGSQTRLSGRVDFRHQWIGMNGFTVTPTFGGGSSRVLCESALGRSFAAGGENGPSDAGSYREGMTIANSSAPGTQGGFLTFVAGLVGLSGLPDPCQNPKPILLATGKLDWVPEVLPFQVFVIGKMAIVGIPFEATTMSGRRIRARVQTALSGIGVDTVVIAGLANSYAGYLTTREEFNSQQYEGASTQYGPYQQGATEQILTGLSQALVNGSAVANTATPAVRPAGATRVGVVYDGKFGNETFGQVLQNANSTYNRGQTVTVRFRGGHPKNNLRTQGTFLLVERLVNGNWVAVADDADWNTTYQWTRDGSDRSFNDVIWRIPPTTTPGYYRIRHFGEWKNGIGGAVSSYTGTSSTFYVF